jgi:hypothetical protein
LSGVMHQELPFGMHVGRRWKAGDHFWLEGVGGRSGAEGCRGWVGERGGRVCGGVPGTRWDFFRDRVAVIRYDARLFPIP